MATMTHLSHGSVSHIKSGAVSKSGHAPRPTQRRSSRERSLGDITSFTALTRPSGEPSSSPEHEQAVAPAHSKPKRTKSRTGIASMQAAGTEGTLQRTKHHRSKGSTASLKSLNHDKPRKSGTRQKEAQLLESDSAWASASGEENSAPQTPERERSVIKDPPSQEQGSTPIAASVLPPLASAELAVTPTKASFPPLEHVSRDATMESPPKSAPLPQGEASDVVFPSTVSAPASPHHPRRARTSRMPSSSSIASRLSTRSMRQPLTAVMTLPPQLDITEGHAVMSSSPSLHTPADSPEAGPSSQRIISGEHASRRSEASELTTMLRETRNRTTLPTSASRSNLARLSGQFGDALRGFLPMSSTGSASSANVAATGSSPNQSRDVLPALRHQGTSRASTNANTLGGIVVPRPFVSKFISPSQLSPSLETAAYTSSPLEAKTPTSSSSGTRLNRTQQRLLLQRAQPYRETEVSPNARATLLPPLNASTSPDDVAELNLPERQLQCQQAQRDWAKLLCREAERVDREHECVMRYRDPAGESFRRILGANRNRGRNMSAKSPVLDELRPKPRRPDSLQRSHTMR